MNNDDRKRLLYAAHCMGSSYKGRSLPPEIEKVYASGEHITFSTSLARPLASLTLNVDSGWTGDIFITKCGKNILQPEHQWTQGMRTDTGGIAVNANHFTEAIKAYPSTTYTLSGTLTYEGSGYRVYFLDENEGWIQRSELVKDTNTYTFTTPANCGYIQIQVNENLDLSDGQLEYGTAATDYVPYTETIYPVADPADPPEIITNTGVNNIWMNASGSIELEYWRIQI